MPLPEITHTHIAFLAIIIKEPGIMGDDLRKKLLSFGIEYLDGDSSFYVMTERMKRVGLITSKANKKKQGHPKSYKATRKAKKRFRAAMKFYGPIIKMWS